VAGDDRVQQTCAYLRMLLLRPGDYRNTWERHAPGTTPERIDYAAVAKVVGTDPSVVEQALEGQALEPGTLVAFVTSFEIRPRHAERLTGLMNGSPAVRAIAGRLRMDRPGAEQRRPSGHETLSLHELHVLGPDGKPAEHQTIQLIRSTVDGLESFPYRFDTDELVVEVVSGGQVGDVYRWNESLHAVDIRLTRPLRQGETALVQIRSTFGYHDMPAPEFRRGVLGSALDLTMWVTFHRDRLPKRVWLGRWDALDELIVEREAAPLDEERSVHARFDAISRAIVGFTWDWEDSPV
jgi:hypothetical protein